MGSQWSHGHARPECFHGSGECASALSLGDVAFYVPIVGAAKQHIPPKSSSSDGQHSLARVVGVAHSVGLRRVTTLWSYGARNDSALVLRARTYSPRAAWCFAPAFTASDLCENYGVPKGTFVDFVNPRPEGPNK